MTSSAAASPTIRRSDPASEPRHGALAGLGWHRLGAQQLPRQAHEVLVEDLVREALIRLNEQLVARYQQVEAANRIVERVVAGYPKKGLVCHFQGSGRSQVMLFAARKLRLHPALGNPTVIIVVDRIDLDTQYPAPSTRPTPRTRRRPTAGRISNGCSRRTPGRSSSRRSSSSAN